MCKIKHELVILLTGTIYPNSLNTLKLIDPEVRKTHYLEAITFYLLNTNFKIVFVENSGVNLQSLFPNKEKRIEFLTYTSVAELPDKGKGFKEMEILNFAMLHSEFIKTSHSILKITGRLKILNVNTLARTYLKDYNKHRKIVSCNVYKLTKMDSRCFFFTNDFWTVLKQKGEIVDLDYSFEKALWDAVISYKLNYNGYYKQLISPSRVKGVNGAFALPYKHKWSISMIKKIRHTLIKPYLYYKINVIRN